MFNTPYYHKLLVASESCGACTRTLKSDGTSACAWYAWEGTDSGGYCGSGECDWSGNCGSTTCRADSMGQSTGSSMTDHSDTDHSEEVDDMTPSSNATNATILNAEEPVDTSNSNGDVDVTGIDFGGDAAEPCEPCEQNAASAATSEQQDRAVSAAGPSLAVQPLFPVLLVIGAYFVLIVVGAY